MPEHVNTARDPCITSLLETYQPLRLTEQRSSSESVGRGYFPKVSLRNLQRHHTARGLNAWRHRALHRSWRTYRCVKPYFTRRSGSMERHDVLKVHCSSHDQAFDLAARLQSRTAGEQALVRQTVSDET
ncbi:hypothetical protein BST61_g6856 [Cercospora zeina]